MSLGTVWPSAQPVISQQCMEVIGTCMHYPYTTCRQLLCMVLPVHVGSTWVIRLSEANSNDGESDNTHSAIFVSAVGLFGTFSQFVVWY